MAKASQWEQAASSKSYQGAQSCHSWAHNSAERCMRCRHSRQYRPCSYVVQADTEDGKGDRQCASMPCHGKHIRGLAENYTECNISLGINQYPPGHPHLTSIAGRWTLLVIGWPGSQLSRHTLTWALFGGDGEQPLPSQAPLAAAITEHCSRCVGAGTRGLGDQSA